MLRSQQKSQQEQRKHNYIYIYIMRKIRILVEKDIDLGNGYLNNAVRFLTKLKNRSPNFPKVISFLSKNRGYAINDLVISTAVKQIAHDALANVPVFTDTYDVIRNADEETFDVIQAFKDLADIYNYGHKVTISDPTIPSSSNSENDADTDWLDSIIEDAELLPEEADALSDAIDILESKRNQAALDYLYAMDADGVQSMFNSIDTDDPTAEDVLSYIE